MKQIPLTQGQVAIVDDEDYEWLSQWKWYAQRDLNTWYAQRSLYQTRHKRPVVRMHQVICGKGADHINGDGLDNRRENLRLCTHQQNIFNNPSRRNSTSLYKGVSWKTKGGKWVAQIQASGKKKHLGYFDNEEDAARAYDAAARQLFGGFAHLNLPEIATLDANGGLSPKTGPTILRDYVQRQLTKAAQHSNSVAVA